MQTLAPMERDRFELDTGSPSVESHVRAFQRLNGDVSGAGIIGALLGAIVGLVVGLFTAVPLVPAVVATAMYTGLVIGGTAGVVAARRRRQLMQNAVRDGG